MSKVTTSSIFEKVKNFKKSGRVFERSKKVSQISLSGLECIKDTKKIRVTVWIKKTKEVIKSVGLFALKTAVVSGVVIGGIAIAVPALGFTAGGVAAGSAAAAYQSAFLGGTIASGSAFATLQSIGAVGIAVTTQAGIVAGSAAATGVHGFIKKMFRKKP